MLEALADRPATQHSWEHNIRIDDLCFWKVPVRRYSSAGTPWTKWVPTGMPKIPKKVMDCACYLFESREAAEAGQASGGTAFLVAIPAEVEGRGFTYAVTNWHAAVRDGASVLRVNTLQGGVDIFEFGPEDWTFDSKLDIAVIPINLDPGNHRYATVPIGIFITKSELERLEIGPGEDVFMVGRFVDHDGGAINAPSLRFGNISTAPTLVEVAGKKSEAFCIDMHSRPGYSGSPVFAFRTFGQDLTNRNLDLSVGTIFGLLGIHCAQFPEMWQIAEGAQKFPETLSKVELVTEGKYVRGLSGMTVVLPAWSIMEVLNLPSLKQSREQANARERAERDRAGAPIEESALSPEEIDQRRDAGLRKALSTPPKPKTKSDAV